MFDVALQIEIDGNNAQLTPAENTRFSGLFHIAFFS